MSTHQSQFLPKLSLLQMKERTISTLLAETPIAGIHALLYSVLVELRRLFPEVMSLTVLGRILRPAHRTGYMPPLGEDGCGLKQGLHSLVYSKTAPKMDRNKLEMELTAAFGIRSEECYTYLNLWLDLYLSMLEIVVRTQQFFHGDVDKLVAYGKHNPLSPSAARVLLMTNGTLRGVPPERFAAMLITTVCDQGTEVSPITLHRLRLWKDHYAAVDEYLTVYRKALKL